MTRPRQPRQPTVNLYCDFDGTLSPLPNRTPEQQQWQEVNHIPPKPIADCYTLDKRRPDLFDTRWSSELIINMRELVNRRFVRWHWLTSNGWTWTSMFDDIFGFDSNLTTTEELLTCHNGRVRPVAGGKPGIIRRALHMTARSPQPRGIAWLDDDYWPGQPEVDEIAELAQMLGLSVLLITPDATVGVTRSQMCYLIEFILTNNRPTGLTAIN